MTAMPPTIQRRSTVLYWSSCNVSASRQCAGIEAWRGIVRLIDYGRSIRLEQLRAEMRMITAYPIKALEGVTVGVAQFENKVRNFVEVGGRQVTEEDTKSDLNAILPRELSDHLSVRVTEHRQAYQSFRDFASHTCAQLLMLKKRLTVNVLDEEQVREDDGQFEDEEDFLAAMNRRASWPP